MIINHTISSIGFTTGTHTIVYSDPYDYLNYPSAGHGTYNMCSTTYDSDRELISMLNMEMWNMYGVNLTFYKTSYNTDYDKVWGEDGNRIVSTAWNVKSYFQLPKENKVWSKFGIEGINDFSMYISKEHFNHVTGGYIPHVGDLVLSSYNNKLYEISEIKEEAPMFLLSKQYAWELVVRKAKVEAEISISPSLSASPIAKFYSVSDIFDIRDDVDIAKEDTLYDTKTNEKPNDDPFGVW